MSKESIIPEFMANNPDDTFQFLMPLKLKLIIPQKVKTTFFKILFS